MLTTFGDLWTVPAVWRVVPTNTSVKRNGEAVMGAGVALEAARRYPALPADLGTFLRRPLAGTLAPIAHFPTCALSCVPTKEDWRQLANLKLIERGIRQFLLDLPSLPLAAPRPIALPLLGCGLGQLRAADVLPMLRRLLDDRFLLVLLRPPEYRGIRAVFDSSRWHT